MVIKSIEDLAASLETTVEHLEHDVYKYTDCGAWIKWDNDTVTIGTIVEGSDAEFSETLRFPFSKEDYDDVLAEIECLADAAWHEANDDEEW